MQRLLLAASVRQEVDGVDDQNHVALCSLVCGVQKPRQCHLELRKPVNGGWVRDCHPTQLKMMLERTFKAIAGEMWVREVP